MKKKIMIVASIAFISVGAFFGVKQMTVNNSNDLMLANVEALATEFTFNGVTYDNDEHWYNYDHNIFTGQASLNTPDPRICTVTRGVTTSIYTNTTSYQGRMVVCTSGNGNCFFNSDCI